MTKPGAERSRPNSDAPGSRTATRPCPCAIHVAYDRPALSNTTCGASMKGAGEDTFSGGDHGGAALATPAGKESATEAIAIKRFM